MACKTCLEAGQTKTLHYARNGRWRTRVYCKHSYSWGRLQDNTEFGARKHIKHDVISKDQAGQVETRRKRIPQGPRMSYSDEMDKFILLNYRSGRFNSHGVVKDLVKMFAERFGVVLTQNQIIGRWTRLMRMEEARIQEQPRGVPSLPVLKFMQGA